MRKQELHPHTAVINKAQKQKSRKARFDALEWLAQRFPDAFDNTRRIRPMKLGVMQEILQYAAEAESAGISRSKLREAVVLFTRRVDYLACLKAQEMRVDLTGNPAGLVTADEAERAAAKIRKRVEKSARNARKSNLVKMQAFNHSADPASATQPVYPAGITRLPTHFPDRAPAYSAQPAPGTRPPSVIVRHKTAKTYDPDAVARLKEKLGLSRTPDRVPEYSEE